MPCCRVSCLINSDCLHKRGKVLAKIKELCELVQLEIQVTKHVEVFLQLVQRPTTMGANGPKLTAWVEDILCTHELINNQLPNNKNSNELL